MDKAEFTRRAQACERKLYRVARTLLRRDADCEDAVQQALLLAWSKRDSLRQPQYFDTWLVRILINECRAIGRRLAREGALLRQDPGAAVEEFPLFDALMALPNRHRIVMELHYVEGYSVAETARMLAIPEGTIKWRLSRGRTLLGQALTREVTP